MFHAFMVLPGLYLKFIEVTATQAFQDIVEFVTDLFEVILNGC